MGLSVKEFPDRIPVYVRQSGYLEESCDDRAGKSRAK